MSSKNHRVVRKLLLLHYITQNTSNYVQPLGWITRLMKHHLVGKYGWQITADKSGKWPLEARNAEWSRIDTWIGNQYFLYYGDKFAKRNFYQNVIPTCRKKEEKDDFLMLYASYCHSISTEKIHILDYEFLRNEKGAFENKFGETPNLARLFNNVEKRRNDENLPTPKFQCSVRGDQKVDYLREHM